MKCCEPASYFNLNRAKLFWRDHSRSLGPVSTRSVSIGRRNFRDRSLENEQRRKNVVSYFSLKELPVRQTAYTAINLMLGSCFEVLN